MQQPLANAAWHLAQPVPVCAGQFWDCWVTSLVHVHRKLLQLRLRVGFKTSGHLEVQPTGVVVQVKLLQLVHPVGGWPWSGGKPWSGGNPSLVSEGPVHWTSPLPSAL